MSDRHLDRGVLFWGLLFCLAAAGAWGLATGHPVRTSVLRLVVPLTLVVLGALVMLPPRRH